MLTLLKILVTGCIGVGLGLAATWYAVRHEYGLEAMRVGVWRTWPKSGSVDIDPYAMAHIAWSGEVPLGLGEGLVLIAKRDSTDGMLRGACDYRLTGSMPSARFWTLEPASFGKPSAPGEGQMRSLSSSEIVRDSDGELKIEVSQNIRAGNWLQIPGDGHFDLILRLYDTSYSASANGLDPASLPNIERIACR